MTQDRERKIIWLVGKADSGKTAVLHTLADELRQEDRLAGTFFFSSAHPKRNSFDYVFPTLAYQLAIQHPRAQEAITKAIANDPALLLAEKSRQDQLEKLLVPPLRQIRRIWASKTGATLILDGLNAATTEQVGPFVTQLAKLVRDATLPIDTIIVSSTLKSHINVEMQRTNLREVVKIVRMEEYDSRDDVSLFLQHAFDVMRSSHRMSASCPGERDLSALVELTNGNFVSATALIKLINKDHLQGRLALLFSMLRGDVAYVWGTIERQILIIVDQAEASTRGLQYLYVILDLVEELANPKLRKIVGVDVIPYLRPFSALQSVSPSLSLNPVQIYSMSLKELMRTYTPATHEKVKPYDKRRHLSSTFLGSIKSMLKNWQRLHQGLVLADVSDDAETTEDFSFEGSTKRASNSGIREKSRASQAVSRLQSRSFPIIIAPFFKVVHFRIQ
ncbi:hypothetical protein CONPUDRAFT_124791 [Coniophora puteana RWD-64-598 SS2]|uniref:NACHT domain-containing protein n=1 Tax=Coniophora puteana (strain RWD-64-598) TaxID=741705 RepID=A0A5M3MRA3_CONPW|nr:uncharacterized protein CONPUDRAFT_124791 [Coniophora puteana RWD-64-598 SS2]EIW81610.1 hypothetical protein CONPUDRAFT_124791 [Coniophora puteana RWD-64-598 SS2]